MQAISYARHQFPAEIIRHATWLYLRFTLSYRDVEELLDNWPKGRAGMVGRTLVAEFSALAGPYCVERGLDQPRLADAGHR